MILLSYLSAKLVNALTGIAAQAIAVGLIIAALVGGIWWLRHDARMDERAAWEVRMANARVQDQAKAAVRQRRSEAISAKAQGELITELDLARIQLEHLDLQLAARPRVVCYPKDLVKALNR